MVKDFLEGQPLVAVEQMDDATIAESGLLKAVLHDEVVAVCVDANVVGMSEAIAENVCHYTMMIWQTRHAVNDIVGAFVVNPFTLLYLAISDVGSGDKGKGSDVRIVFFQQIAVAVLNVLSQLVYRRVGVVPLMEIAGFAHDAPSGIDQSFHFWQFR